MTAPCRAQQLRPPVPARRGSTPGPGVVRAAEDQHPGARGELALQAVEVHAVPVAVEHERVLHHLPAVRPDAQGERVVHRAAGSRSGRPGALAASRAAEMVCTTPGAATSHSRAHVPAVPRREPSASPPRSTSRARGCSRTRRARRAGPRLRRSTGGAAKSMSATQSGRRPSRPAMRPPKSHLRDAVPRRSGRVSKSNIARPVWTAGPSRVNRSLDARYTAAGGSPWRRWFPGSCS